jgi:hypothetical protein
VQNIKPISKILDANFYFLYSDDWLDLATEYSNTVNLFRNLRKLIAICRSSIFVKKIIYVLPPKHQSDYNDAVTFALKKENITFNTYIANNGIPILQKDIDAFTATLSTACGLDDGAALLTSPTAKGETWKLDDKVAWDNV